MEKFNGNDTGILVFGNSNIGFDSSQYSGQISNNTIGMELLEGGISRNADLTNIMTGNGDNHITSSGGAVFEPCTTSRCN